MYGYMLLARPKTCAVSMLSVLIGIIVALSGPGTSVALERGLVYIVAVSLTSFGAIIAAGSAVNDYFDREHNRVNKPWKPIPSGKVSPQMAMFYASALFFAGIALAGMINYVCFMIAVINSILLIIYSKGLQNSVVAGRSIIGYIAASSFLFGAASAGNITAASVLFFIAAFLISSVEIMKGLEDLEGDRKFVLKTIISGIGKRIKSRFGFGKGGEDIDKTLTQARSFAFVYVVCAILLSVLPYVWGLFGVAYVLMAAAADVILAVSLFFISKSMGRKQFRKTQSIIRKGLYVIIFAFVLASVFSL